ncbi:MAG TPA: glycosyltransferase family 4 protein [Puia sp.]|nr:glycosyltransferase family 4 protein [Puia sp.]
MNIVSLIFYPFLPAVTGGQKGHSLFYKYFSRHHQVCIVTTRKNDPRYAEGYEVMNILTNAKWRYVNPFYFFKIRRILREKKAELLIIEHAYLGWLGVLLKHFCGVRLLVHSHNLEGFRWKSLGKWWWKMLYAYEGWTLRRANYNFFISDTDRADAIRLFHLKPDRCITVTFGIERKSLPGAEAFEKANAALREKHGVPAGIPLLFFNGAFRYEPNREALEQLLYRVNPLLQQQGFSYRLLISGVDTPEEWLGQSYPDVQLIGFAEDLSLYLKGCQLFLNPVIAGGGIKTKLVEALGYNLNVVSTKSGSTGVDPELCNGKLVICEDGDWKAFASAVVESANKKADISPAFYEQFYWGNITKRAASFISTPPDHHLSTSSK